MTHNRNKRVTIWTLAITSIALFMVSLDNLVVTTALPVIRRDLLENDRVRLRAQMQAYSACDDPEICEIVRNGFGDLVTYVERVSGASPEAISAFFAHGMLLNVLASMDAPSEPWGTRLVEGCKPD